MRIPALAIMIAAVAANPALAGNDGPEPEARSTRTAFNTRPDDRGQLIVDCSHRASDHGLIGIDRQDYVEWCTSRGFRYDPAHLDDYWDDDRRCYGRANDRVMTGERRAEFLSNCLTRDDDRHYSPR
jgi:hypothetical protein